MSNIYEYIKMAIHNIMANKGRSFLTMLGIIIGIASVIAIVSIGEGTKNQMNSEIDDIGGGQDFASALGHVARVADGRCDDIKGAGGLLLVHKILQKAKIFHYAVSIAYFRPLGKAGEAAGFAIAFCRGHGIMEKTAEQRRIGHEKETVPPLALIHI